MIDFSQAQWNQIEKDYSAWWARELDRPLIVLEREGEPSMPEPEIKEPVTQRHFGDLSYSEDAIARRIVYDVSRKIYKGDAYPFYNMDCTGPGVMAAYFGGRLGLSSQGMIWFYPMENRPEIQDLHLEFDSGNPWYRRTVEIIRRVGGLTGGNMVMGFPDMGGVMDILSSFLPSEELFFAMRDEPREVHRLISEIEEGWSRAYDALFAEFKGFKGYSDWSGIYSPRKTYIHQCDFSYMIGPGDFDEFVLPTLKREFAFIDDSIYHLDGKGEIQHLDELMACENLQGVQWVPGDGGGLHTDYPELMRKILRGGKNTFIWGTEALLRGILEETGTLKGVYMRLDEGEKEADLETLYRLEFSK